MIAYIKGKVEYSGVDFVVIENRGMGYKIRVPAHVLREAGQGADLMLHTYMYVREDDISLFGFSTRRELDTFETLLSISGIGPKVALAVLSTLSVEDLYYAVFSDDVKAITKTPGIGPKGAKRMIMELKDKLDIEEIAAGPAFEDDSKAGATPVAGDGSSLSDAAAALTALGYSGTESWKAVRAVPGGDQMDVETLLKAALKHML